MDVYLLADLLRELIIENDRVSLPGMGSFVSETAPSVFSDRASIIHPPFRRVMFRSREVWNDELLEKRYAQVMNIPAHKSKSEIETFINGVRRDLEMTRVLDLPGLGTIRLNERNGYNFVLNNDVLISKETYGLEPLNIKVLSKPGVVENIKSKPLKLFRNEERLKRVVAAEGHDVKMPNPLRLALMFILIFVIIIVILLFFSDQLKPLWEILLYNKHERELIRLFS